jgi:hypothetical protein
VPADTPDADSRPCLASSRPIPRGVSPSRRIGLATNRRIYTPTAPLCFRCLPKERPRVRWRAMRLNAKSLVPCESAATQNGLPAATVTPSAEVADDPGRISHSPALVGSGRGVLACTAGPAVSLRNRTSCLRGFEIRTVGSKR